MTNQALPGRPPVHDLTAFDLSKRSPEQVARSFARWKAQRKQHAEAGPARADPLPKPKQEPDIAGMPEKSADATPDDSAVALTRASAKRASMVRYTAPFSDLLAAGSEPTVQRTDWAPIAAVQPPRRTASPGRRLKLMSILAGAASILALAGGALLELADWRDPVAVTPPVARPRENPVLGSLATAATSVAPVEWTLQPTVDLALMKAAPDDDAAPSVRPTPEPPTPAVQTASKAAPVSAGDKPVASERKDTTPKKMQFVAKPFVPNEASAPISTAQEVAPMPTPPMAAVVHAGDPRPDALFQHGRDSRNGTVSNRAASSGKPTAETGSTGAIDVRPVSARSGTVAGGGNSDPRGEGSGGARVGVAGEVGAGTGSGSASGGKSGVGDAGDARDGGANGSNSDGSSAGAAGGGDPGGAAAGDSDTGGGTAGGDTGGDSAGSGDPSGGDSGTDGADAGGSGEGDTGEDGESGGIGGALGAVGEALGDALGGGKGNPDSNGKD